MIDTAPARWARLCPPSPGRGRFPRMLVASGLPTSAKIALGVVAFAFIAFALISSFVLPRRNPNFPGAKGLKAYILVAFGFFVAMMLTVILVAKEPKESSAAPPPATTTAPGPTTTAPAAPSPAVLAAGKKVFTTVGCSTCHTLKDANATGKVGPDLDQLKPVQARVVRQVTNGGKIMPSFKATLSPAQIQAVATYVSSVTGKS
jgi:cytochrome c6